MNSLFATARRSHPLRQILGFMALLSILIASPTNAAQPTGPVGVKSITLGLVSGTYQKEIQAHFEEFVRYVARKLGAGLQTEGKVVLAPAPLEMAKLLEEKKVDFYMESPYPTYLINKQGAAMLLVRRWKNGMAEYRSLIFSKKSNATSQLGQLRGKMIAFEDPGSTSGFFLPKVLLLRKGFKLTEKKSPEVKVGPNEIGYVFASTAANVVNLVLSGKVAAGAFSDDDYSTLEAAKKADISILAQSDLFPRHLVSVRKDLDPRVKNRLQDVLLAMSQEDEGQRIMQQTDNTTKFDLLPGGEAQVRRKLMETFRGR